MTNWTERLLEAIDRLTSHGDSPNGPGHRLILTVDVDELERLAAEARTALAQHEPEGLTDEEIAKCLIAAGVDAMEGESDGTNRMYWEGWHEQIIAGSRAVIAVDRARWARPTIEPVPVDEQPEPEGVTEEQWDAIKDRLWSQYETHGYQGERFIYEGDFYTALDVARQELTRYARPAIEPVPITERPWEREGWCDANGMCWLYLGHEYDGIPRWIYVHFLHANDGEYTHSLPYHALPLPGAEAP